jgi:MATE family multidrug resistance protein
MGIRGAAIGTVIAGVVPPLLLFSLYFSRRVDARYETRSSMGFNRRLMTRLIRFGLPSGLHLLLDVSSFSAFVLMTGHMGALSLAVSNIALSINTLAFMPLVGISIAASTLVGQYQGRRDSTTAEKAGWTALKVGLIYMTGMALSYLLMPRLTSRCFPRARAMGSRWTSCWPGPLPADHDGHLGSAGHRQPGAFRRPQGSG